MAFFSWLTHSVTQPVFWFQPVFYTFHGWLATEMALWMLFHPYNPVYIPGTKIQLPFTPGIFPRGRRNLSVSIANTITDILLTKDDIKKQAQKLITEENIFTALDAILSSVLSELKDITHIRRIYRYVDNLLPPLLQKLLNDFILALESGEEKQFEAIFNQLYQRVLPKIRLEEDQARFLAKMLFENWATPPTLRNALINALTPETIDILDESIRAKVGGVSGFILKFVDTKKGFYQFRHFLTDEIEEAEQMIAELIVKLNLQERIAQSMVKLTPQQLPVETLESMRVYLLDATKKMLVTHREDVVQSVCNLSEEATHSITSSMMHIDFTKASESWLPGLKRDLASFIYTYLHKELENLLSKALPAISLNTVIIEKIDQFSAQELEETIQKICHRELRWLAFLGAFLGFWLGLVSNVLSYWLHPTGH